MLLNSHAVAKMHMGEYQEAESSLIEVGETLRGVFRTCNWLLVWVWEGVEGEWKEYGRWTERGAEGGYSIFMRENIRDVVRVQVGR